MTKEVEITALTYGGRGLARIDGKVVFVPFSVPGDRLKINIIKEKKSFAEGEIAEIITPGADRVEPLCPVFGSCGGCAWQNIKYAKQVEWKLQLLKETLERIGGVDLPVFDASSAAEEPYNYRSRARFQIDGDKWGFFAASSHTVVDIDECPLVDAKVSETFSALKELLNGKEHGLCHVEIALSPNDGKTVASLYSIRPFAFGKLDFLSATPLLKGVELLRKKSKHKGRGDGRKQETGRREGPFTSVKTYGEMDIEFSVSGHALKAPGGSFTQVNAQQNEVLIEKVLSMSALQKSEVALDLFCGVGNLTMALAREAGSVTGVEIDRRAVDYARANTTSSGENNVEFECADVAKWLHNKASKSLASPLWDVVVLDPPRGGTPGGGIVKTPQEIVKLAPRRIIYVSCSPPTLARDISYLRDSGYVPTRAAFIDMFPQTFHIESVVALDKEG